MPTFYYSCSFESENRPAGVVAGFFNLQTAKCGKKGGRRVHRNEFAMYRVDVQVCIVYSYVYNILYIIYYINHICILDFPFEITS